MISSTKERNRSLGKRRGILLIQMRRSGWPKIHENRVGIKNRKYCGCLTTIGKNKK